MASEWDMGDRKNQLRWGGGISLVKSRLQPTGSCALRGTYKPEGGERGKGPGRGQWGRSTKDRHCLQKFLYSWFVLFCSYDMYLYRIL